VGSYPSEQPGRFSFDVALGDFEVDGRVDIATIGSQLSVLANNGAGIFSTVLTTPLIAGAYSGFVADVNHDGRPDLIMSSPSGLQILLDEPLSGSPPQSSVPLPAPLVRDARESARSWRELSSALGDARIRSGDDAPTSWA
jgi:hypothetical protein